MGLPDLEADLLVPLVHLYANAQDIEALRQGLGVFEGPIRDGQHLHLGGHHPGGQGPCVLLDQVRQRPLVAAQAGPMDDVGQGLLAVLVDVVHAEALSEEHVDLDGDQGILLAVHVPILDVQLGSVEGGLVDADLVLHAQMVQDAAHGGLGGVPLLRRALVLVLGVGGIPLGEAEGALVPQAHRAQEVLGQLQTILELRLQLIRADHEMPLGDGELADADKAVHLAGILVAEQGGRFTQAHGQIPIAPLPVQVHLILEGAGHGPEGEAILGLVVRVTHDEHAVPIVVPMAGDLIELPLGEVGGLGQEVPVLLLRVLHPALHELDHPGALGKEHRQALADHVHRGEVFELPADLVVVPLLGLLEARDVSHQLVLFLEGRAVDPLQHLVLFRAPPVGPGHAEELDVLHPGRAPHVGAGAQVHELALLVEADNCVFGQVIDEFHFIGLALLLHEGDGLRPGQLEPLQLQVLPLDLLHGLLDLLEVVGGEVEGGVEIVVEPLLGGGADGQLHLGPQPLHGLGQDVGSRVPVGPAAALVLKG